MKIVMRAALAVAVAAGLAACSFQNRYERLATGMTQAAINNNLKPMQGDLAPGIRITRVQVAEWSDELSRQGTLESVKEHRGGCPVGVHCFVATFSKRIYLERLRLDSHGKIVAWRFFPKTGAISP
ncbi:MAG: hypothetical protein ACYDHD_04355 [Vulcanimicrobiaceae bacterium]